MFCLTGHAIDKEVIRVIEIEYGDIEIVDDTIQEEVDTVIEFEDDLQLVQEGLYEQYLKKHQYDPENNTIFVGGRRVNAGKTDVKTRQRINAFLRDHKYNPNDETILSDYLDENGNQRRISFSIGHGVPDSAINAYSGNTHGDNIIDSSGGYGGIELDKQLLAHQNRGVPEGALGHEQGHRVVSARVMAVLKDANNLWKKLNSIEKEICNKYEQAISNQHNKSKASASEIMKIKAGDPSYKSLIKQYTKLCNKLCAILKSKGINIEINELSKVHPEIYEKIRAEFQDIKEAQQFIDLHFDKLNDHDQNPEEFVADIIGEKIASKYTGRYDGGEHLSYLINKRLEGYQSIKDRTTPESIANADKRAAIMKSCDSKYRNLTRQLITEFKKFLYDNKISITTPCASGNSILKGNRTPYPENMQFAPPNNISSITDYSTITISNNPITLKDFVNDIFFAKLLIKLESIGYSRYKPKSIRGVDPSTISKKIHKFTTDPSNKPYLDFLKIVDGYCDEYISYCKQINVDTNIEDVDYSKKYKEKLDAVDKKIKAFQPGETDPRSEWNKRYAARQQALERSSSTPATHPTTDNTQI